MARLPISVTLIKPSNIDTPYTEHARNLMDSAPRNPPPVYAPGVVADAVLFCAEHSRREVVVGGGGKMFSLLERIAPRLTDRVMEATMEKLLRSDRPNEGSDSLFMEPLVEGQERGRASGRVFESSLYTTMALHPLVSAAALLGIVLLAGGVMLARTR